MAPEAIQPDDLGALPAAARAEAISSVDWFVAASKAVCDQTGVLASRISRRVLTMGIGCPPTRSSPIGDVPAAWELKSLGEVARFACGKTKPKDASHVSSAARCIPIFSAKGLLGFSGSSLRSGATIVVGRVGAHCGSVHFVSDAASWITDGALFVYETRPEVDLRFLYYSLRRLDLPSLRHVGRQPSISLSTIYPLLLALPPRDEQGEICNLLSSVEALQESHDKVLAQSTRLRSVLAAYAPAGRAEPGRSARADVSTPKGA